MNNEHTQCRLQLLLFLMHFLRKFERFSKEKKNHKIIPMKRVPNIRYAVSVFIFILSRQRTKAPFYC